MCLFYCGHFSPSLTRHLRSRSIASPLARPPSLRAEKGLLFRVNKTAFSICLQGSAHLCCYNLELCHQQDEKLSGCIILKFAKVLKMMIVRKSHNLAKVSIPFPRLVGQVFIGGNKTLGAAWRREFRLNWRTLISHLPSRRVR